MAQDESIAEPPSAGAGYAVGYGKPPLHTRFRKGISGNPRGRPRRKTDLGSLLTEALDRRNSATGRKPRTRREAVIATLVEKSAAGDLPATKLLFELLRQIGPAAEPPERPPHPKTTRARYCCEGSPRWPVITAARDRARRGQRNTKAPMTPTDAAVAFWRVCVFTSFLWEVYRRLT